MKKLSILFVLFTLAIQVANAQLTAKGVSRVMEKSSTMSLGNNNAMVINIDGVNAKLVGKVWEDYMDKRYDAKVEWERKAKEWFIDNLNLSAIGGATPIDMHATAKENGDNVTFTLWVNLGTTFLNSTDNYDQFKEAEKLVDEFAQEVAKEKTRLDIEAQEKQLKQLEKELEKLVAANTRYHSDIEKAKEAIRKAEENIVQNEKDQENARQKIENQKQVVDGIKKKLDDMK